MFHIVTEQSHVDTVVIGFFLQMLMQYQNSHHWQKLTKAFAHPPPSIAYMRR